MTYNIYPGIDENDRFPPQVMLAMAKSPEVYERFLPRWKPFGKYVAGEAVLNPNGDVVTAKIDFISSEVYTPSNWNISATYATPTQLENAVAPKLDRDEAASTYALKGSIGGESAVRDSRLGTYNFKEWHVQRIRGALANVALRTGHAKIGIIGDSISLGAIPPDGAAYPSSYPTLLRQFLEASGYPKTGTGLVTAYQNLPYAEPRITWFSGMTSVSSSSNMAQNTTTANGIAFNTITSGEKGTVVDVYYDNTSAPFDINVDGGAKVRVTPNNTSSIGIKTITGLADTTHEVIAWRVSGTMKILGFDMGYEAGYGVKMYNSGLSGVKIETLKNSSYMSVASTVASSSGWSADLTILTCIANDAGSGTDMVRYREDMQTLITQLKLTGTDLVLTTGVPSQGVNLMPYVEVLYELALLNDIPVIDTLTIMGTHERANALGMMKDAAHCTAKGYAALGRMIFKALPI
jgi:Lysophospholipase L1 and related esterases